MSFDTSFHPVPHTLVAERILPFVLRGEPIDDLFDEAVRLARVRFAANAWGLGAIDVSERLEPARHVWGRPFLVVADTVAERARQIDAFLASTPEEAAALARHHLDLLEPGLSARVRPADGALPPDDALRERLAHGLMLMRQSLEALRTGDGLGDVTPEELGENVGRELMRTVLDFAAAFRPGWMSRGPTWPTHLLHDRPVRARFVPNVELVQPVVEAFPDLPWATSDSIEENWMVGGLLPAGAVDEVRAAVAIEDVEREKLVEALADAVHRGLPFAEATEIYSGPMGILA